MRHLRIFDSIAFAQVPAAQRKKLDARSGQYVFVGYDDTSRGYKLFDVAGKKILTSRDVKFYEDASWD